MNSTRDTTLEHNHNFIIDTTGNEKKTWLVIALTLVTMAAELCTGYFFGSMSLLADGWHMSTHAAALGITLFAYHYSRKNARNTSFSFGTGKVTSLGGFSSSVFLILVAFFMIYESILRFINPVTIHFNESIIVAVIGLSVNIISAFILGHHSHESQDAHSGHGHHHHDHNIKAAYLHVIADALTSLCAIIALTAGKFFGWIWLDACMGIIGALVIIKWGLGLLKSTSSVLLDKEINSELKAKIKKKLETNSNGIVTDLHLWEIGPGRYSTIIALAAENPETPAYYKKSIDDLTMLFHVTIEVNPLKADYVK